MRFARTRRALGPLEPAVASLYHALRARRDRWLCRSVVVVATDSDERARARQLADDLDGRLGFWLTCADDVVDYGSLGWFVVRIDPDTASAADIDRRVAAIDRHVRVVEVIDLRDGPRDR